MPRPLSLTNSIEIDASSDEVSAQWLRLEELPYLLDAVRRVKRIDERRSLWDAEIAGRQVVWEARILEEVPGKRVVWESAGGARNRGRVLFESLPDGRMRLRVEIEFHPRSLLERLAGRLGVVDVHVRFDLNRFASFVERHPAHARSS